MGRNDYSEGGNLNTLVAHGKYLEAEAKFWLEKREKASAMIAQLLANPDMALPTEEPFIPKGSAVARTAEELTQDETVRNMGELGKTVLYERNHREDLARKIALDAEFMGIIGKTNLIEILNTIIDVNNTFWSDGEMQSMEMRLNCGVSAAHTALQEGKMPCFKESDAALLKEGKVHELSREGQIARVIYAKLLAEIFIKIQKGLKSGETHRYEGVRSQTARIEEFIGWGKRSTGNILTLPEAIHFGIDGIARLQWENSIKAFLKNKSIQENTREQVQNNNL